MSISPRFTRLRRLKPSSTSGLLLHGPLERRYHSYDHPPPPGPFNATESAILSASVPHIPSHGFTHTSLSLGARDAGYLDASTNLFPAGAFSLVHYHLVTQRGALVQHQHLRNDKSLGVGAKVRALTWHRLTANQHIIHRWQEALALMSQPRNMPTALSELHALSDEIWFLANDVSVDTSWYTKRLSLSSIYAATELYMTIDKSPDFVETKAFLDRRLADAQTAGGAVRGLGQWAGFTASAGINVLRSKGLRI